MQLSISYCLCAFCFRVDFLCFLGDNVFLTGTYWGTTVLMHAYLHYCVCSWLVISAAWSAVLLSQQSNKKLSSAELKWACKPLFNGNNSRAVHETLVCFERRLNRFLSTSTQSWQPRLFIIYIRMLSFRFSHFICIIQLNMNILCLLLSVVALEHGV